jgi:hypothetical protein
LLLPTGQDANMLSGQQDSQSNNNFQQSLLGNQPNLFQGVATTNGGGQMAFSQSGMGNSHQGMGTINGASFGHNSSGGNNGGGQSYGQNGLGMHQNGIQQQQQQQQNGQGGVCGSPVLLVSNLNEEVCNKTVGLTELFLNRKKMSLNFIVSYLLNTNLRKKLNDFKLKMHIDL